MTPEFQLIISVSIVLIVSCVCSLLEAALYSLPASQIEMLAGQGRTSGKILKKLHADIQRPISAILTLNTLANTGGAAIAGAAFVGVFPKTPETYFTIAISLGVLILFGDHTQDGRRGTRPVSGPIYRPSRSNGWCGCLHPLSGSTNSSFSSSQLKHQMCRW